MNDESSTPARPAKGGVTTPILIGIVIALVVANAVTFVWLNNLKGDVATMRGSILAEVAKVRETAELTTSSSRQHLNDLRDELATARKQAATAAGEARKAALKHADQLARQIQEEQAKQQAQVTPAVESKRIRDGQYQDLRRFHRRQRMAELPRQIGLDKTSELRSVRATLACDRLIATNSRNGRAPSTGRSQLPELGIAKSAIQSRERPGAVEEVDVKRNKYTPRLIADDKRVEKKDKVTNEPVQFYMAGARTRFEIVVNEVGKA
jgi:F0F1-type ATP synthase membrane subunit b/b'